MTPLMPLLVLILVGVSVFAWWTIFAKTGFPRGLAFAWIIPLVGFLVFLWFAFSDWPVLQELRRLRGEGNAEA
ncbi:MAG: hypothetical protein JRI59_06185 [Deltaproteobacteria bacterium]|nr:hypothetical protein [Deltaproteobacteria bacterium]